MKKKEVERIFFIGSRKYFNRLIYKRDDNTYWVQWYGKFIQVDNKYGCYNIGEGWVTVEDY